MSLHICQVPGDQVPLPLLLQADPSEQKVKGYLNDSACYIAETSGVVAGVYVLRKLNPSTFELMNISVHAGYQGKGIGSKMLTHAIAEAKRFGAGRLEVGTGTFGYQLAFYQKAGFRVYAIAQDFFLKNYDFPLIESGIQHKDMLRLALDL
ncbi:GNAT family N-acetyltransferase [Fulvivirgaceae bacterium BMA12]|uniref:GNAT family N-acetyltransferase n=1 Tax=Agaribacillus aureus TaxID=3051825 RepID=A0ABT8L6M0_9BACT|nr:GNAT family N-acetyltransferase [Fulvivirgaceae bacterium BMA12]